MRKLLLSFLLLPALSSVHAAWNQEMKIGPAWSNTFYAIIGGERVVGALKGVLVDLGDNHRVLFDTETLRIVSAYRGGVKFESSTWGGRNGPMDQILNEDAFFTTESGPGWADPGGNFNDKRKTQGSGDLEHAKYKGYFRNGGRIIFTYEVNGTAVLESYEAIDGNFVRQFQVAPHRDTLNVVLADHRGGFDVRGGTAAKTNTGLSVAVSGKEASLAEVKGNRLVARINPSNRPVAFTIAYSTSGDAKAPAGINLSALTKGGEGIWKQPVELSGAVSNDKKSAWVVDTLNLPTSNPWGAMLKFGGFDFIDEDTAAISTWNGDVWTVSGLKGDWSKLTWRRFASGLFETLGLKVVDGVIMVHGRDQITKLIDLNGDGEADYYEPFFRDYVITPNFHEYPFELQTDKAGNFYTTKAGPVRSGGRGFDPIGPHHGALLKISPDGSKYQVVATGLRAAGGIGVGPNGEITTGENEGTWQPSCKLNFFIPGNEPVFLGTEQTRHGARGGMTEPLCYFPMSVDNSSGSQVWVPEGNTSWGLRPGELIHLSYGQSSLYRVLPAPVEDTLQGGVVRLPVRLLSSAFRARFHPDGSLYVCGLRGWQTNAASDTAFQRIRYRKDAEILQPSQVEFTRTGVRIHFEVELDKELAEDPASYSAERWNYVRGPQYGSGEFSVDRPDRSAEKRALEEESKNHHAKDKVAIKAARLSPDGKVVEVDLERHKPSMQLVVNWQLETADGEPVEDSYAGTFRKPGN